MHRLSDGIFPYSTVAISTYLTRANQVLGIEGRANPLVLQAGAPLQGAFDARSLCHGVVVPFEQTVLEKRLGGANEPFLNKPARYTHLSMDNAVRRGKDRTTLPRLIEVFEMVNEQENGD